MPQNFWWLFAAYTIVWLALLGYAGSLASRLRRAEKELEKLRSGS